MLHYMIESDPRTEATSLVFISTPVSTSSGSVSHVVLRWMKLRIIFSEERGILWPSILQTQLRKFRSLDPVMWSATAEETRQLYGEA